MKKVITFIFTIFLSFALYAQCPGNGDLEQGSLNNWQAFTGLNVGGSSAVNLASFLPGVDPTKHVIETNPFFIIPEGQNTFIYKDWQTVCMNLSDFMNQQVTVFFLNADCTQQGHFAYAYIDGLCTANPPTVSLNCPSSIICSRNNLIVNGGGTNYDSHNWSIKNINNNNTAQSTINSPVPGSCITSA